MNEPSQVHPIDRALHTGRLRRFLWPFWSSCPGGTGRPGGAGRSWRSGHSRRALRPGWTLGARITLRSRRALWSFETASER